MTLTKNTPKLRFSFPTETTEKEKEKEAENEVAIIREIPRWKNDAVRTTSCDAEKMKRSPIFLSRELHRRRSFFLSAPSISFRGKLGGFSSFFILHFV